MNWLFFAVEIKFKIANIFHEFIHFDRLKYNMKINFKLPKDLGMQIVT